MSTMKFCANGRFLLTFLLRVFLILGSFLRSVCISRATLRRRLGKLKQMEDSRELYRASVDEEDRISNLPVPLICHILSFLRTPTVVATSVLSKRWRFLWTEVTTLNFLLRAEEPDTTRKIEAAKVRKFVEFVNWVSLHMKSQSLQKFKLKWWDGPEEFPYPGYVLIWTSYAISRCVRELVIDLGLAEVPEGTQLPGTLFTCSTLTVLKVRADFLLKVPGVVCLPKLEVLELGFLCYESNECINKLISCCPALHHLMIGRYTHTELDYRVSSLSLRSFEIYSEGILVDGEVVLIPIDGKIEIDAPNLEFFGISEVATDFLVRGITTVDRAELDLNVLLHATDDDVICGLYSGRCNSALKLVEAMNRAKYLELDSTFIKALSYATTPYSACFERLIELKVSIPCCHWSSLRVILGSTTKLRYLYITKVGCGKNTHRLCWDDPTKVPECLSSSLRKVSIVEFQGLEDEMEMIKYILQHGEVLELFTLKSASDLSDINQKFLLLQQISTFPRISRACQFRFD